VSGRGVICHFSLFERWSGCGSGVNAEPRRGASDLEQKLRGTFESRLVAGASYLTRPRRYFSTYITAQVMCQIDVVPIQIRMSLRVRAHGGLLRIFSYSSRDSATKHRLGQQKRVSRANCN
jgi:hypothetical protein